jgi:Fur family transcriptional regulator, ferric uptake regulator
MAEALNKYRRTLAEHRYSKTKSREKVFVALLDQNPMSIGELARKLRGEVDRASVYRTVELFEQIGIIERIPMGWKYKLELSDEFTEHHHHISCVQCNVVVDIEENNRLENQLQQMALSVGFTPVNHHLEIRGICRNCSVSHKKNPG